MQGTWVCIQIASEVVKAALKDHRPGLHAKMIKVRISRRLSSVMTWTLCLTSKRAS